MSFYFVGYSKRSRRFKFNDPLNISFFETNAKLFEDVEFSGSDQIKKVNLEEEFDNIPVVTTEHIWVSNLIVIQVANLEN